LQKWYNLSSCGEKIEKTKDMNEFEEYLGARKEFPTLHFGNAKEMLQRGLQYFVGENATVIFPTEYEEITHWMTDNQNKGLLLYGTNGRGKSLICYNILPALIGHYYPNKRIFKCRANDLRLLQGYSSEYYEMSIADIIAIDDFGTEDVANLYGERRDIFSDVVDLAEHEKKLLLLSTNLMPTEINERYGLRTLDRLRHITRAICLPGKSMRSTI
jgi:DNA replication protein DnaC